MECIFVLRVINTQNQFLFQLHFVFYYVLNSVFPISHSIQFHIWIQFRIAVLCSFSHSILQFVCILFVVSISHYNLRFQLILLFCVLFFLTLLWCFNESLILFGLVISVIATLPWHFHIVNVILLSYLASRLICFALVIKTCLGV